MCQQADKDFFLNLNLAPETSAVRHESESQLLKAIPALNEEMKVPVICT